MPARPLILVIAIYVGLDLSNPFMPGAFIFDPEQSVEGVHGERGRPHIVALAGSAAPRISTDPARPAPARPSAPATKRWFAEPPPTHVPASDPPPLSEDH
jgi:hypothetical protein